MISLRNCMLLLVLAGLMDAGAGPVRAAQDDIARGRPFAQLVIDSNEVYLGEPFEVIVLVEAPRGAVKAGLSGLKDFHTRFISSRSGSSALGARYELHYALVARRGGRLTLPSIAVAVGNETLMTQAVDLTVLSPQQTDSLGLDISLSKDRCYVGEALELRGSWRVDLDLSLIRAVDLNIPLLDDERFEVFDRAQARAASTQGVMGLPVGNRRVIARASAQGGQTTLSFTQVLVPRQTGHIEIDPGSVYCTVLAGPTEDKPSQYPSYFDNDFFKRDIKGRYQRCYALSEGLRLEVEPLPEAGRPAAFAGLVSAGLELSVKADPLRVTMGAPMTVEVHMRARQYIETLELPPLSKQPRLAADFVIPGQRPSFAYASGAKVFTQSLRALHSDVETIGAIAVPYFDTDLGKYMVARSKPIAIEVFGPKTTGAEDIPVLRDSQRSGRQIITHILGITAVFAVGMGAGMGLSAALAKKRRHAKAKSPVADAQALFKRAVADLPQAEGQTQEEVYSALRTYLGAKLRLIPHSVVCNDVTRRLQCAGVHFTTLERLTRVFSECEVYRFGRCYTNDNALNETELKELALACVDEIDRHLNSHSTETL